MKQILIVLGLILCLFGMLSHEVKAEEVVTQPVDEVVDDTVVEDEIQDEVVEEIPTKDEPVDDVVTGDEVVEDTTKEQPNDDTVVDTPTVPIEPEEPVDVPIDEPIEEMPDEEEVTIGEMFADFKDKWLSPFITAIAGVLGTLLTVLLSKVVVNKLGTQLLNMGNSTDEEKKQALKEYNQAKIDLDNAKTSLQEQVTNTISTFKNAYADSQTMLNKIVAESKKMVDETVKQAHRAIEQARKENAALIEQNKDLFAKFTTQQGQIEDFKVLIGYLVSGIPELASNGYATKILELLNEGSVNDVKKEI